MLAFTPLPRPSDSTTMVRSTVRRIRTWSPHSSSPWWLRLCEKTSKNGGVSVILASDRLQQAQEPHLGLGGGLAEEPRDLLRHTHLFVDDLANLHDRPMRRSSSMYCRCLHAAVMSTKIPATRPSPGTGKITLRT